jgi:hypothetical protein
VCYKNNNQSKQQTGVDRHGGRESTQVIKRRRSKLQILSTNREEPKMAKKITDRMDKMLQRVLSVPKKIKIKLEHRRYAISVPSLFRLCVCLIFVSMFICE